MYTAVMQPYFFPYLGYWQLLNAADTFVLFDDVNFIKRGYINRNSILFDNTPKRITLELKKASQNKLINEISIGNNRDKLQETIRRAYSKAPFFSQVFNLISEIMNSEHENLALFLEFALKSVSDYLKINTVITKSSSLLPSRTLKGEARIIDIVTRLKGSKYINAIGGRELYSGKSFHAAGLQLNFIKMNEEISYRQFRGNFVANLSIIDVMMFNSVERITEMLGEYILIKD
jgi:hypothetical protein